MQIILSSSSTRLKAVFRKNEESTKPTKGVLLLHSHHVLGGSMNDKLILKYLNYCNII